MMVLRGPLKRIVLTFSILFLLIFFTYVYLTGDYETSKAFHEEIVHLEDDFEGPPPVDVNIAEPQEVM